MPDWQIKKVHDNKFLIACPYSVNSCSTGQSTGGAYPAFGWMDSLGVISSFHYYEMVAQDCWNIWLGDEVLMDGSAVVWGQSQDSFFILRADSIGDVIWAKRFMVPGEISFVKQLPTGDLIIGARADPSGSILARINDQGDLVWSMSYFPPGGVVRDAVVRADSTILVTGFTNSTPLDPTSPLRYRAQQLFAMVVRADGTVAFCKSYETGAPWSTQEGIQVVRSSDGDYTILGHLLHVFGENAGVLLLFKVDTVGDPVWARRLGLAAFSYTNLDLLALTEGGFLLGGYVEGSGPPNGYFGMGYLLRTDSLGQLPCYDLSTSLRSYDRVITPVPVSLLVVDGATVNAGVVQPTAYDPVLGYDGCLFDAVPFGERLTFHCAPNPTDGHFVLQFDAPLPAGSSYSIFDSLGRLLITRAVYGASTVEVGLDRPSSGVYWVKVSSPGTFSTQCIVVAP